MNLVQPGTCSTSVLTARKGKGRPWGAAGFTLIEIIVVVTIIAILALLAVPAYEKLTTRVRVARAAEEIRVIEKAILAYSTDRAGALPPDLATLGASLGLSKDPWGRPYEYHLKSEVGYTGRTETVSGLTKVLNSDYDLFSLGQDGLTDPEITNTNAWGNIIRMNDGGSVGEIRILLEDML